MAVLDMVGIASIFPFLNVMTNPDVIQENPQLKWAYNYFNFNNKDSFLVALGIAAFVLLIVNNLLRAGISIVLIRFSYLKRYTLSKLLLEKYLYEPYAFFLNRNTSELTAYLASEIAQIVSGILIPCLQVFARALMALLIIILLVVVNPVVASVVIVVIGGGYIIMYGLVRKTLSHLGAEMTKHNKKIYKALSEAFGGIKDIKVLNREEIFIDKFIASVKRSNDCFCWKYIIFQMPRYAFEILVFGGMLFIVIFIVVIQDNYQNVVPIIGLYAFAAYRLMPTLQQIYQDIANIRSSLFALNVVYQDYMTCSGKPETNLIRRDQKFSFSKEIKFQNVSFQYPKAQEPVIGNLNITIKANTTVGLVGGSGAGKTTLTDILLGLFRPQQGEIIVDGQIINQENLRQWQANIGYVPQHIYLCDDTVTRNIAFGVSDEEIDRKAVQRAARLSSIHDFVVQELPNGYETEVGERGVRLSGGQRQRLGIARALYHSPSLLVFDEATSALDGITEDIILEAIHNLAHKKTIILIAHRLSTVKECDIIYMLSHGKVVDQGAYDELLSKNQQFRKMAKVSTAETNGS
ncbi:MAG: ABC transporter ATP-binding protein [Candidatus Omnitrophica bacterium]|nr:ABC transporter ATP-binding protein [Candidatus Omnitrophota bacterium]